MKFYEDLTFTLKVNDNDWDIMPVELAVSLKYEYVNKFATSL